MIARCLATMCALGVALASGAEVADATVQQPPQPTHGPGGADYPYAGVRVLTGGVDAGAWVLALPARPVPRSAPLTVVLHGYREYAGYEMHGALVRHTARTGAIVVYPRWQTSEVTPCPGPFLLEACLRAAVRGIHGAIAYLRRHPELPQPEPGPAAYFGFSFGGILTANALHRHRELRLPTPHAVWLDDPHDSGLAGHGEPALSASLAGIPASAKVVCHAGAEGVIGNRPEKADSGCNALFPRLAHVTPANKSLVMTRPDAHGTPPLSSAHGVCAGPGEPYGVDAYDWGFCWRSWDALRACASKGRHCRSALGDTPQNRRIGEWSDGTPISPLAVQLSAPIRP